MSESIEILLEDGRKISPQTIKRFEKLDVAILYLDAPLKGRQTHFADRQDIKTGDRVLTLVRDSQKPNAFALGIVSSESGAKFMRIDHAVGASFGPSFHFNDSGELIAMGSLELASQGTEEVVVSVQRIKEILCKKQ